MKKPEEPTLDYSMDSQEMLQDSQTKHDIFVEKESDFIGIAPYLAPPFATLWQSHITDANNVKTDEDFLADQEIMTQDLNKLVADGCDTIQTVYFYVEHTFNGDKAILHKFGRHLYDESRKSPLSVRDLLRKVATVASDGQFKPQLMTKGLTQAVIDKLEPQASAIETKFNERDKYMSSRLELTQKRVLSYNQVWADMVSVCDAAKLVYKNNYAMAQQFLLYDGRTQSPPEKTE